MESSTVHLHPCVKITRARELTIFHVAIVINTMAGVSINVNLAYHEGVPGVPEAVFKGEVIPRLLNSLVLHEIRKELAHAR